MLRFVMAKPKQKEKLPPLILTATDVERLLKDDSPDSRIAVLDKVAGHYNLDDFQGREREIAEHIFRLLMKDAALKVRETLAQRIKENEAIPRDIVLHMAHDVDAVSLPVLEVTKVLSDADLIEIIEISRDMNKPAVIAGRKGVSERVSEALVLTQYPEVVSNLLANHTASISEKSYDRIIDEFSVHGGVMDAMVSRANLPVRLVEKLVSHVSNAMAGDLKKKYKLTDEQIAKDTAGTRDDVMLKMLRHDISEKEVLALVAQMAGAGRLTHSLAMTALCRGQLTFFTAALSHFSGVSMENTKKLISDKGELGFKGIYTKSKLPASMFEAIRLLLQRVQELEGDDAIPGSLLYANRLVERVLAAAAGREIEYLPYFIALIRQNVHRH